MYDPSAYVHGLATARWPHEQGAGGAGWLDSGARQPSEARFPGPIFGHGLARPNT
jgi:hypothetical protein